MEKVTDELKHIKGSEENMYITSLKTGMVWGFTCVMTLQGRPVRLQSDF